MTAVQDWLKIVPTTPQTMLTFACGLLGLAEDDHESPESNGELPRISPGLERC